MNKLLLAIIIVLLTFITTKISAQTVTGKVLEKGKIPVVYATVQINKSYGVLTNEEGQFLIETKKFKPTDTVTISYLGYKSLKTLLKDFTSKDYYLKEDVNTLAEISISNKKWTAEEIIEKVKENAATNYISSNTKQQIFHRATNTVNFKRFEFEITKSSLIEKKERKKLNKSIDSLIGTMVNIPSKNYEDKLVELYKLKDTSSLKVIKATRLINKKNDKSEEIIQNLFMKTVVKHLDSNDTYKVKTGWFKIADSLKVKMDEDAISFSSSKDSSDVSNSSMNYLRRFYINAVAENSITEKSTLNFIFENKKYKYKLKETSVLDNELIYIIDFSPKKRSAKYSGTVYVNAYDFAVVKADFKYAKNRSGKGLNLKFLFGVKFKENLNNVSVLYKKNEAGLYGLQFLKVVEGMYMYAHRPFKFTKNRASKSEEKRMMKIDVLMEMNQVSQDELFFISESELTKEEFNKQKQKAKYKTIDIPKYDAKIWEGYNVINPIEEIKNYDTGSN